MYQYASDPKISGDTSRKTPVQKLSFKPSDKIMISSLGTKGFFIIAPETGHDVPHTKVEWCPGAHQVGEIMWGGKV